VLLVPGTGILDDFNESPFGLPYEIWRWCHAAKLGGAKIGFVSVGAGPIAHWLSRTFMRGAARRADYRSYRDGLSKDFMDSIGTNRPKDPVFPDLAFGLPTPPSPARRAGEPLVVAVGVMAYYGWAGGEQGQGVYETYIAKLAAYVGWLVGSGRRVKFVVGAQRDAAAIDDLRARVLALDPRHGDGLEPSPAARNLHDVMRQMAEADIAVATRFHNLVCALHVGRPTLSLGYGDKNHALMADTGLAEFSQPVEAFDLDRLIARTEQMIAERAAREAAIRRQVAHYEAQLAIQEDLLVERFGLA
jgi:polysaccharide pyruvyl transferase WcaK-like protein